MLTSSVCLSTMNSDLRIKGFLLQIVTQEVGHAINTESEAHDPVGL